MTEFTVHINSPRGAAENEDVLGAVHDGIQKTAALGPAVAQYEHGVLGATFQLEAETVEEAAAAGAALFAQVLFDARVPAELAHVDRLEVERECEHMEERVPA